MEPRQAASRALALDCSTALCLPWGGSFSPEALEGRWQMCSNQTGLLSLYQTIPLALLGVTVTHADDQRPCLNSEGVGASRLTRAALLIAGFEATTMFK